MKQLQDITYDNIYIYIYIFNLFYFLLTKISIYNIIILYCNVIVMTIQLF